MGITGNGLQQGHDGGGETAGGRVDLACSIEKQPAPSAQHASNNSVNAKHVKANKTTAPLEHMGEEIGPHTGHVKQKNKAIDNRTRHDAPVGCSQYELFTQHTNH